MKLHPFGRLRTLAVSVLALGPLAGGADGALTITIGESGPNVVATYSGSLDLTGLTAEPNQHTTGGLGMNSFFRPELYVLSRADGGGDQTRYTGIQTSPVQLAVSSLLSTVREASAISGAGGFGIRIGNYGGGSLVPGAPTAAEEPAVYTPSGYTSGTPISVSETYEDASLSTFNFMQGVYEWSWPADKVTLNIIPEPSTASLLALVAGGVAFSRRRRP